MSSLLNSVVEFACDTGFAYVTGPMVIMWIVSFVLMYLAIVKKYEPLLLLPISLGALAVNIPSAGFYDGGWSIEGMFTPTAGLYYYISQGIHLELFPPIIFLGVGAMTDFGPLIANPRTLLLGGGAQFGVFATMFCAVALGGFTLGEAASIGIIGGADGPTSIFTANKLAKHLIGPIAVAAYTYMALVPLIQPPIMRLMTNDKERRQHLQGSRRCGTSREDFFQRAHEHRDYLPRYFRGPHDVCRHLPEAADPHDYRHGRCRLRFLDRSRPLPREDHELVLSEEPREPAYRFCWRVRRADGRTCFPGGRCQV